MAVLALALGIGANTAIFSLVNGALLRPLAAVQDPDRLVTQGREFTDRDRVGAPLVAILNEKLANRLWPGESAVGKLLSVPFWREPRPLVRIIGVARDTKHRSLLGDMPLLVYQRWRWRPSAFTASSLIRWNNGRAR